jgi:putative CocE/NonD family hydrolase
MVSSIRVDRDVPMEMRDGTLLRGDIYRPDDDKRHPAILMRTPYNKLLAPYSDYLSFIDAAFAGYAVIAQDVRGRFTSDGKYLRDQIIETEGPDGYDTVEWVAAQRWCDGSVGMAGASYNAHLQWIAAMEKPPHLKAIAPWISGSGLLLDDNALSGTVRLRVAAYWTPWMGMDIADKLQKEGNDVSEMRRMIVRALANPEEVYSYLPLKDVPHFQFDGLREIWYRRVMAAVPTLDLLESVYWPYPTDSVFDKVHWAYSEVQAPCFLVGGWFDIFSNSIFENFRNMRQKGGSQRAREGQHLLIGPWAHDSRLSNCLGDFTFGLEATGGGARLTPRHIQFYNKYLLGIDIEIPAVTYFVMGLNQWRYADTWPLPQTQWQRFFLHSKGHANTAAGDGLLNRNEPSAEPTDAFVYDPHFPVPTVGGRNTRQAGELSGPLDQSHIEQRDDVLCYTTEVLQEDVEVTGPLVLHLFASTSTKDTDFTAKIVDVHPDGQAYNIADGVIRARYRKSVFQPKLVNPGEVNEYIINMWNTSYLFRNGHRIRIDISSSNFPRFDRNMNTGNPIGEDAHGISATQTIYHTTDCQSYIDLPVIPSEST